MIVLDTHVISEAMKAEANQAVTCGFIVASRDTSPYEAGGLQVVDPWQS